MSDRLFGRADVQAVQSDFVTKIFATGLKNVIGSSYPQSWLTLVCRELQTIEPDKRPLLSAKTHYEGPRVSVPYAVLHAVPRST